MRVSCNEGPLDRASRAVLGLGLLALPVFGVLGGIAAGVAYALAAVLLVTAAIGFCPAYRLLGISTCPVRVEP